ncbi:MAG: hypothetical protein IH621_00855 [Krumholzibacteria bacterium]|nr:hypothetical protein [Candidatus Krumholzibacteria bacterium]
MDPVITCPFCKAPFTLEDLVASPDIAPIGMMLNDDDAAWNFYYFNHMASGCGTTFTVSVEVFAPLLNEAVPEAIRTHSCDCEGRCTSLADLAECGAECHWAPYRRFLGVLRARTVPLA